MFYPWVVENVPELGKKAAMAIQNWIKMGLNCAKIHLIGYSLGAHLCGEIGRTIKLEGCTIPRITGLDPAGLLYCYSGSAFPNALNKTDAAFVDVIHTDGDAAGCYASIGHADFFPNNGKRPQPMCGDEPLIGLATIKKNMTADMGYYCSTSAVGDYNLVIEKDVMLS